MLINSLFFVFYFFLQKTNSQVHPEHFTSFTMDQGVQTKHKIEGHQIVRNYFYFHSIERAPLIYGYYCDDVQNFNIKESKIFDFPKVTYENDSENPIELKTTTESTRKWI